MLVLNPEAGSDVQIHRFACAGSPPAIHFGQAVKGHRVRRNFEVYELYSCLQENWTLANKKSCLSARYMPSHYYHASIFCQNAGGMDGHLFSSKKSKPICLTFFSPVILSSSKIVAFEHLKYCQLQRALQVWFVSTQIPSSQLPWLGVQAQSGAHMSFLTVNYTSSMHQDVNFYWDISFCGHVGSFRAGLMSRGRRWAGMWKDKQEFAREC